MRVTAIVPTFRRPKDLMRCLECLKKQTRRPDEVIVIVRDIDTETRAWLDAYDPEHLPLRQVMVYVPGQVAALNAALDVAEGDVVAITDDDGGPRPQWLERVEAWFERDPRVGGVGGPDWTHVGDATYDGSAGVCGHVQWFGRIDARASQEKQPLEVDILKGCNMSFRRRAIEDVRFDTRLAGTGAQVFNDFAFCLAVRRAGWKLIYDPQVEVDHYPASRADEDQRNAFVYKAHANAVHNRTLLLLTHLSGAARLAYVSYALLLGSRPWPGLALLPPGVLQHGPQHGLRYWSATAEGHVAGLRTFLESFSPTPRADERASAEARARASREASASPGAATARERAEVDAAE
jgi:GT2 family glycosyltransferase